MTAASSPRVLVADGNTPTGAAVVRRLVADGASVAYTGSVRLRGARHVGRRAAGLAGVARLGQDALEVLGGLDGLVVSCGEPPQVRLSETEDATWDEMLSTHVLEPWRLMTACAPALQESGGSIVAVASAAEEWPSALRGAHSVGVHALVTMTRMLAAELASSGVRVNALCPDEESGSGATAAAVAFLLSADAAGCTAASLLVDGGRRASLVAGAAVAT